MSGGGIAGIVLVAGKSERMGVTKQLLPFGDRTMAALVVANAEASQLDQVVVVTGHSAADVVASLACQRALVVHNDDYEAGNVTSLLCGIAAADDPDAVLLLLGDMPGVGVDIVDEFVDLWRHSSPWAAVAVYDDGVANHPFLLSAAAVAALPATTGSKALWTHLVEAPPQAVTQLRFTRPAPIDVDTIGDYDAALAQAGDTASGE